MDIELYSKLVEPDWISFKVTKLLNTQVLWSEHHRKNSIENLAELEKEFLHEHSYVIADAACFKDLAFDVNDIKSVLAERYGGAGIGKNGGGARCATYGTEIQYNTKGIGPNWVVGEHDDKEHSYGGLDARKAIVETIYSQVLGKVLPLGTVNVHGLIYTGPKSGYNGIENCWGVLMVRDGCLRPGHFMKSVNFVPSTEFKHNFPSELARMRALNKRIFNAFGTHNNFIKLVGDFVKNTANQFAFARVLRLSHGTISPSNIALDGRWLDLPITSFLSGGINYNIWGQFYTEHLDMLNFALEMLHSYSKYNNFIFNQSIIINYFNEAFDTYFKSHLCFALGIEIDSNDTLIQSEAWSIVATTFMQVIHSGKIIEMRRPVPDPKDPVIALIIASFLSLYSEEEAKKYFILSRIDEGTQNNYKHCLHISLNQHPPNNQKNSIANNIKENNRIISYCITAVKRSILSAAFYLPAVDDQVKNVCATKSIDDVAPFIDSYLDLGEWIFASNADQTILFKSPDLQISYAKELGLYTSLELGSKKLQTYHFDTLYKYLKDKDSSSFTINNFDYFCLFETLKNIIPIIERSTSIASAENFQVTDTEVTA